MQVNNRSNAVLHSLPGHIRRWRNGRYTDLVFLRTETNVLVRLRAVLRVEHKNEVGSLPISDF